jgi:hypothetical protein
VCSSDLPFADRYYGELWERTFPDRT